MGKINKHPHSLNKWINGFFILFIFNIIVLAGGIYYFINSYASINNGIGVEFKDLTMVVSVSHKGIIGLTSFALIGICFVWFYLNRFILSPLNYMRNATEQIIHGRLDQTIKMNAPLEITRLYESINDLSVNLQEIMLFVWNQTENSLRCIEGDGCEKVGSGLSVTGINMLKNNMLELQKMVSSFTLYDVRIDKKKLVDGSENGQSN